MRRKCRILLAAVMLVGAGCATRTGAPPASIAGVEPAQSGARCDCAARYANAPPSHTATIEEISGAAAGLRIVRLEAVVPDATPNAASEDNSRPTTAHSGGLGIVFSPDGLILTAAHVVRGALRVDVVLPDGTRRAAIPSAVDESLDLAMLRTNRLDGVQATRPIFSRGAAAGMRVTAIGQSTTMGAIDRRRGIVRRAAASLQEKLDPSGRRDYSHLIETSALLEPGCSGGPLLSADGRLLGVNVAIDRCPTCGAWRGYAQPISAADAARLERLARR